MFSLRSLRVLQYIYTVVAYSNPGFQYKPTNLKDWSTWGSQDRGQVRLKLTCWSQVDIAVSTKPFHYRPISPRWAYPSTQLKGPFYEIFTRGYFLNQTPHRAPKGYPDYFVKKFDFKYTDIFMIFDCSLFHSMYREMIPVSLTARS
jgi:hypothetical protein